MELATIIPGDEVDITSIKDGPVVSVQILAYTMGTRIIRTPRRGIGENSHRIITEHLTVGFCPIMRGREIYVSAIKDGTNISIGVLTNTISSRIECVPGLRIVEGFICVEAQYLAVAINVITERSEIDVPTVKCSATITAGILSDSIGVGIKC
jgi:hypothetical protein